MQDPDRFTHYRRRERRHMIAVKQALAASLDTAGADTPASIEFQAACADYLGFIIDRFVAQGMRNLAGLKERVPEEAAADWRTIRDIERTLSDVAQFMEALTAATARVRTGSSPGRDSFVAAARSFVSFYDDVLTGRKDPAQHIVQRYFTPEQYQALSDDVTTDSIAREQELFERAASLAPPQVADCLCGDQSAG